MTPAPLTLGAPPHGWVVVNELGRSCSKYCGKLTRTQSRCDLIYIDGGHDEEEAASDLLHMSMLARSGTVLVMDDVGCALEAAR